MNQIDLLKQLLASLQLVVSLLLQQLAAQTPTQSQIIPPVVQIPLGAVASSTQATTTLIIQDVMPKQTKVSIESLDAHFYMDAPRVNEFSVDGVPTSNKIILFKTYPHFPDMHVRIALNGDEREQAGGKVEYQNIKPGEYQYTITVTKDSNPNEYAELTGTVDAR